MYYALAKLQEQDDNSSMPTYWDLMKAAYDPTPACVRREPITPPGQPANMVAALDTSSIGGSSAVGAPLKPLVPLSGGVNGGGSGMLPTNPLPALTPTTDVAVTGTHIEGTVAGPGQAGGTNHVMDGKQKINAPAPTFKAAFEKAGQALGIKEVETLWVSLSARTIPTNS